MKVLLSVLIITLLLTLMTELSYAKQHHHDSEDNSSTTEGIGTQQSITNSRNPSHKDHHA